MSFFDRLGMTMRADANGLIDALEEPTLMLKQHLRDAELAVQQKRAQLERLDAESKRLARERQCVESDRERLDRDAALALGQGRDDLARYALRQSLPKAHLVERIDRRLSAIAEEAGALASKLEAQALALDELRARAQAYIDGSEAGAFQTGPEPVSDEQIEIELLRRKAASPAARAAAEAENEKA